MNEISYIVIPECRKRDDRVCGFRDKTQADNAVLFLNKNNKGNYYYVVECENYAGLDPHALEYEWNGFVKGAY
jgi:hypothetical protein